MSTTTKFTPGPWKVYRTRDGRSILGVGDKRAGAITDGGDIATNDLGLWRSGEVRDANANLIAAAPELYDVAEATEDLFRELTGKVNEAFLDRFAQVHFAARAALAKARGEVVL